jgi:hypothetical protein
MLASGTAVSPYSKGGKVATKKDKKRKTYKKK